MVPAKTTKQILCLSDMTAFSIVWVDKELYKNKKSVSSIKHKSYSGLAGFV